MSRILSRLQGSTLKLLLLAGSVLLVWGMFAPVGTLTWWMAQRSGRLGLSPDARQANRQTSSPSRIDCYIVYFPGVGDYSANQLTSGEEYFLNQFVQSYPNCVAVSDVFPYSTTNTSLGEAPFWSAIKNADGWLKGMDVLIKIRNLWRFAISADDRYGQVYNRAIAMTVIDRMKAAHPIPTNQPLKLVLVGTSGGAQVALGASPYLKQWLNPQLTILSIGGDFEGTVGFDAAHHVYHLQGTQDWIEDLSRIAFPSRWRITVGSPLNQARRQGRYTVHTIGPHEHSGSHGYFGLATVKGSDVKYVDLTLQSIRQLPLWSKSPTQNQPSQTSK